MHAAVPGALVRGRLATHPPTVVLFLEDVADSRETHALPALIQRTGVSATTNFTTNRQFRKAVSSSPSAHPAFATTQ